MAGKATYGLISATHTLRQRKPMTENKGFTYVSLVSGAVQVDAVPARREECLGTHAQALLGREGVGVRHRVGVEANVRDGLVLVARGIESADKMLELRRRRIIRTSCSNYAPSGWVSNQHDEALRRGNGKRS